MGANPSYCATQGSHTHFFTTKIHLYSSYTYYKSGYYLIFATAKTVVILALSPC